MKIYNQEKKDGLANSFKNNAIAVSCQLNKVEDLEQVNITKAKAAIGDGNNFDIYYLSSVLASIGSNANDDVFLPEELWNARNTPIHKQFNYNHNEKDIIGCIFDSFILDAEGSVVDSEANIDKIKDICTYAALWTKWEDPELQARMNKSIAEIEAGNLFVSMEVLFKNFDYLLIGEDKYEIIQRSEATSFLTKHLRSFGGEGNFQGDTVHRVLRNFTFSGKGLVENPANKRSLIDINLNVISKGSAGLLEQEQDQEKGIVDMTVEIVEKQLAEVNAKLAEANKKYEDLKEARAAERETLISDEVKALATEKADLQKKVDSMQALATELKKEVEDAKAELVAEQEKHLEAIAEINKTVEEMKTEKVVASRVSKLVEAGQTIESAEEIVSTWASSNDEQFENVVALYKKVDAAEDGTKEDMKEDKKDSKKGNPFAKKEDTSKASDEDFDETVDDKAKANLNDGDDSEVDEEFLAIAKEMRESLTFSKTKDEA